MWQGVLLQLATFSCLPDLGKAFEPTLLARAKSVRRSLLSIPSSDQLNHPSSFKKSNGKYRGFCNWIIPNRVMIGQYPGQNPEKNRPSEEEVRVHIKTMVEGEGVSLFCSLQSEIPGQDDFKTWARADGKVYLDEGLRQQFPNPFTHYAPIVATFDPKCRFLHNPIEDLSVPSDSESLNMLLLKILEAMDTKDGTGRIYIHCWGGRGRAGLVGSCLLSLLWPELNDEQVLQLVQKGYDSRAGAKEMPLGLKRSPQTEAQRNFVRLFVEESRRAQANW